MSNRQSNEGGSGNNGGNDPTDPFSYNQYSRPEDVPLELLPKAVELCKQEDDKSRLQGAMLIRKMLAVDENPPIDEVVRTDVCPILTTFMQRHDYPELQFEATWALTNVTSGTQTHTSYVIQLGALPHFIKLLDSPDQGCREQACWAIGNIAGDSYKFRDCVLEHNVMDPLLRCIQTPCEKLSCLQTYVWALSNLCRGKPPPKLELVAPCLPIVAGLLKHQNDEVVTNACSVLSYISDGTTCATVHQVRFLIDCGGVIQPLCDLLDLHNPGIVIAALEAVKNLVQLGENDKNEKGLQQNEVVEQLHKYDAVQKIESLQDHENNEVYVQAVAILEIIGVGADQALVDLQSAFNESEGQKTKDEGKDESQSGKEQSLCGQPCKNGMKCKNRVPCRWHNTGD